MDIFYNLHRISITLALPGFALFDLILPIFFQMVYDNHFCSLNEPFW